MRIFSTLLGLLGLASAQDANCDYNQDVEVDFEYHVYSPNYPQYYPAGKQCRWIAHCPSGHNCRLDCPEINLPKTTNCTADRLLISKTGDYQLADGNQYCGLGSTSVVSEAQTISIGLISPYNSPGGRFYCYLRAQAATPAPDSNCRCGYKKSNRIVGGQETGINEYPPMAGVVDARISSIKCGGVIIDPWYVLTAAHCLAALDVTRTAVVVGEHNVNIGDSPATQGIAADRFILHPQFNSQTYDFDMAIILLQKPIAMSDRVGPVCLPFKYVDEAFVGKMLTALGWGTTSFGGPTSAFLRKVDLKVISQNECRASTSFLSDRMICTYTPGKDACQDDSGGPLLYTDPTSGLLFNIGIISSGMSCASRSPGINTRVPKLLSWIRSVTPLANYCVK